VIGTKNYKMIQGPYQVPNFENYTGQLLILCFFDCLQIIMTYLKDKENYKSKFLPRTYMGAFFLTFEHLERRFP
jgi:hypothetical protein